jgi:hypothetical protein
MRSYRVFNVFADSALLIGITELCRVGSQFDESRRRRTLMFLGAGLLVGGDIPIDGGVC